MSQTIQRKMTEEVREKLKALGGFNLDDQIEIIPNSYKELPKDLWPIFTFEPLNTIEKLDFTSKMEIIKSQGTVGDDVKLEVFKSASDVLAKKLLNARNLVDSNGQKIENTENVDSKFIINSLNIRVLADLAVQLTISNKLTEEEKEGLI